jgi:hypothetical protein
MSKKGATAPKSVFAVHPVVAYTQAIIDNMPEKTGRPLPEWVALVRGSGIAGDKERAAWLKREHKLGGTTASIVVEWAGDRQDEAFSDPESYLKAAARYVEDMYSGPKDALRPIHDALVELGLSLGNDVKISPCRTIVPFYREHVFAQIKPATRTRVDFGLALKGVGRKLPARLLDTGGLAKGDRITHRFALASPGDVDAQVREWARIAYELDA